MAKARKEADKHIEIAIDVHGNIFLETVGTEGKQCDTLAGNLEKNLGLVTNRIDKDSFFSESINSPIAGYRDSGLLNITGFVEESLANGPGGPRAVVWTQGCQHACRGCQNMDTWDTEKVAELIAASDLAERILANPKHLGVTYSGGEPFLQARGLVRVSKIIREKRNLTTVCYSGFTYEELTGPNAPDGAAEFLSQIDLLIDGRYVESLKSPDPAAHIWRGSANQRLIWLKPEFLEAGRPYEGNVTEVHVLADGAVIFTGFGGQEFHL